MLVLPHLQAGRGRNIYQLQQGWAVNISGFEDQSLSISRCCPCSVKAAMGRVEANEHAVFQ